MLCRSISWEQDQTLGVYRVELKGACVFVFVEASYALPAYEGGSEVQSQTILLKLHLPLSINSGPPTPSKGFSGPLQIKCRWTFDAGTTSVDINLLDGDPSHFNGRMNMNMNRKNVKKNMIQHLYFACYHAILHHLYK